MSRSGIVETWRDFGRGTKILFFSMLLCGVLLLSFATVADIYGANWLEGHAYIPNILAGFTGFLIGVPVALVGLATITGQREEKAASDRVKALTQIAWNQYRDAVLDLCGEDRISALETGAKHIQAVHDETIGPFQRYYDVERTEEKARQVLVFANQQISVWGRAFDDLAETFGTQYDLALRWFAILRDWNTLDQYVRLQRLERGLPWFERELDSYLLTRMSEDEFPMADFFQVHEGPLPRSDDSWQKTMWGAYKSLPELGSESPDGLSMHITVRTISNFPSHAIDGYMAAVERSVSSMRALTNTVRAVGLDPGEWTRDL